MQVDNPIYMEPVQHRSGLAPVGGMAKRVVDAVIAGSALLFALPLFIVLAMIIKLVDRGPVFYAHSRVGLGGRRFNCLKFRSMVTNGNEVIERYFEANPAAREEWEATRKLRCDPRITFIGRFLRKSSLDELPQLINVLRGDMSIVGPRPVVDAELAHYGRHAGEYLKVRPGITGLWQISGRSDTSYQQRVNFDVEYVRSWSLISDLRIILLTVPAVLMQRGSV